MRRVAWWGLASAAVLALAGATLLRGAPGSDGASHIEPLHAACMADMLANTCRVMGGVRPAAAAQAGDQVFIAGVGAVAAADYRQMYEAGDAMCSVVRAACLQDWRAARCVTARRVFGLP